MNSVPLLSILTFFPLIGALLIGLLPKEQLKAIRGLAILTSAIGFLISLAMFARFNGNSYHFQMVEKHEWISELGIRYHMGVDGVSVWLLVLTTFLTLVATIFSVYVNKRVKEYMICMLVLSTAMLGVFTSLDMILFYVFFEMSLIPMWLMVAIWGGERRVYAGFKFFIYTFSGSIFMLVGMITMAWLHQQATGQWSFGILDVQANVANGSLWQTAMHLQPWLFWSFALAFLVKCPAFPFHTWLPDAHVEAPTAGSIILAGVLLKMGTYGFLRFVLPFFPDVLPQMVPYVAALAVVGIIYGAIVATVQPDVKKLVAYSSVAHMGFVLIGIISLTHEGLVGGAMQQLNHGVSTGALFLLIGLLYERRHTRMFKDFGGLKAQMPVFAWIFLVVMLSSVGLPGTNGFIGEFLAMFGFFKASYMQQYGLNIWFAVVAGAGVILAAVYLLWMFQKMFYGPNENPENQRLKDLKTWEIALCGSLVILIFWGGLYPNTFLKPMEASLNATRMMATGTPGHRPTWLDTQMDIAKNGDLIRIDRQRGPEEIMSYSGDEPGQVLKVAQFMFPKPAGWVDKKSESKDGHEGESGASGGGH